MRYQKDTFLSRAKEIYDNKYDYSKVVYVNQSTPITIVCPKHGGYMRTPSYHLRGGECPVCAREHMLRACRKPMSDEAKEKRRQTNLRRYGATTFAGSQQAQKLYADGKGPWAKDAREKAKKTCEQRFGAKTWAESDIGIAIAKERCMSKEYRAEMSRRSRSDEARQHYAETSYIHHGAKHWTQSSDGKQRLHDMFSTEQERAARSERMLSPDVKAKIRATSMERYGVPYYWQSEDARKRLKELLNTERVQQQIIETKKARGTINSSKPERLAYELLVDKFGKDDVESQYNKDARYPYACDFYIRSLDLFIELNATWLHCGHWFDEHNEDDLQKLQMLFDKAQESKPMYKRAIYIWTYDDLRKRQTAIENHINYLVFWDNDLNDFKEWLKTI